MHDVLYHATATCIVAACGLSAYTFALFGWRASRAGMPATTCAAYVTAFVCVGLTGIAAQLVWG